MWRRRAWFSLKGKAGIPGQTEGCPATSIGPRVPPVGSLQQRVVGWSMAEHLKAGLCIDALVMALQRCQPPRGLIHHSDRGVQLGFKGSSQHRERGGCDGHSEAA